MHTITWNQTSLDATNSQELRKEIEAVKDSNLIIDLSEIRFLDSSGLGVLISAYRRSNLVNGDLCLIITSKSVLALFDLMKIGRLFDVYPTIPHALKYFPRKHQIDQTAIIT